MIRCCRVHLVYSSATFNIFEIPHIPASIISLFLPRLVFFPCHSLPSSLTFQTIPCPASLWSSLDLSHLSVKSAISLSARFIALLFSSTISFSGKRYACTVKIGFSPLARLILDCNKTIKACCWLYFIICSVIANVKSHSGLSPGLVFLPPSQKVTGRIFFVGIKSNRPKTEDAWLRYQ